MALVIGNGAYEHATKLPNAVNDAVAIESRLKAAGYKTILCKDADVDTLTSRLEEFYAATRGGEIALIFYAGHGIESDNQNYLLPTDAKLNVVAGLEGNALIASKRALLKRETVPLDTILTDLSRTGAHLKLIVLDCCRNDPKLASRAWTTRGANAGTLANVREDTVPEGTMLVFSTAPGTTASDGTGNNSPFTVAVLENLQPDYSVFQIFTETAKSMKGQEPYIRFDGSGKAMAAFSSAILVPGGKVQNSSGNVPEPSPQRKSMLVKVDVEKRELPLIPARELADIRMKLPQIGRLDRAFRFDVNPSDIGKNLSGFTFEARNSTGGNAIIYDNSMGNIFPSTFDPESQWTYSSSWNTMFEAPKTYFTPPRVAGETGWQKFSLHNKNGFLLERGKSVPWTEMKVNVWLSMKKSSKSSPLPIFMIVAEAELATSNIGVTVSDKEAVLFFHNTQ